MDSRCGSSDSSSSSDSSGGSSSSSSSGSGSGSSSSSSGDGAGSSSSRSISGSCSSSSGYGEKKRNRNTYQGITQLPVLQPSWPAQQLLNAPKANTSSFCGSLQPAACRAPAPAYVYKMTALARALLLHSAAELGATLWIYISLRLTRSKKWRSPP